MAKIDVHGLTEEEKETLKQLALQHTGKANISGFVKQWLRAQRDKPAIPKLYPTIPAASTQQKTMRLELKLPPHIADYLTQGAKIGKMSANRYALAILAGYIDQHPILTGNEVTALYQSNYQLVKIGNNLNQIARQVNAGGGTGHDRVQVVAALMAIDAGLERLRHAVLEKGEDDDR